MTPLVERTLAREGLLEVLEARRRGEPLARYETLLRNADILALGALADVIRTSEVGSAVTVYVDTPRPDGGTVITECNSGLDVLRGVAVARVLGAHAERVCVDFASVGFEIAQVALGFGASELRGPIANRRGLPIAEDATKKVKGKGMVSLKALKQDELATLVRRAGREPVFAESRAPIEVHA